MNCKCFISETTSVTNIGGNNFFEIGQCQDDQFSVTSPGNNAPPVICGTNSGEHSKLATKKWTSYLKVKNT